MATSATTYDLGKLRKTYEDIERRSRKGVLKRGLLPSIDRWLQILLDCHGFAMDCRRRNEHTAVMEAFASVSSVAYSNAETARVAVLRGFYGNAFALTRPLAMANDLVIDLTKTADSAGKWLELRGFKPGKGGKKAERLREYFKDGAVRQRVKELGEYSPSVDLYSILSDPVHAGPWATHMYSFESLDEPGSYSVQYEPQYNPGRALLCGGMVRMTLPHLSGYFLEYCEPDYLSTDERYRELAVRHTEELKNYEVQSRVHMAVLTELDARNKRVRGGESFDAVFR